jgi:hypothetical protein
MAPVTLPTGQVLQPECKSRQHLPKWLSGALAQALRYAPEASPLVVLRELGSAPLAVLPLADFARLVGLQPPEKGETRACAA